MTGSRLKDQRTLTIYTENKEILAGKLNGTYHLECFRNNRLSAASMHFNCLFCFPINTSTFFLFFHFASGHNAALNIYT